MIHFFSYKRLSLDFCQKSRTNWEQAQAEFQLTLKLKVNFEWIFDDLDTILKKYHKTCQFISWDYIFGTHYEKDNDLHTNVYLKFIVFDKIIYYRSLKYMYYFYRCKSENRLKNLQPEKSQNLRTNQADPKNVVIIRKISGKAVPDDRK